MSGDPGLPPEDLLQLETALQLALETGDESRLDVLGYGEVSTVVAWEAGGSRHACKRLPPFRNPRQLDDYARCFDDYLAALGARGIRVVDSVLQRVKSPAAGVAAWCVQPIFPTGILIPSYLRECGRGEATAVFSRLVGHVVESVDARLGLDAQISNWVLVDGALLYLDVTTPMLRDEDGAELVDTALFMASLPWALRPVVARTMLRKILDKYYDPRGVVLDVLGNLYKERLTAWLPHFLEEASAHFSPPFTIEEVNGYYRQDARGWALLQRLRRLDRLWQRHVRHRTYPFLLPGVIER